MAARYWIGGTGNWNDPLHWSATSGGIGGASVPTMNDDVYFDSNSGAGTITVNTIANMRDCTFAQTQLITLANAAYAFNIYGNWTLCSNTYLNTSFTGTGYVYLNATTPANITSNGCSRSWNKIYINTSVSITNIDDFNVGSSMLYQSRGTWYTNNKTITVSNIIGFVGGFSRVAYFGSSNIFCSYFRVEDDNQIINSGTSNIFINFYLWGRGQNYFNVTVGTTYSSPSITGANTFNNLSINGFNSIYKIIIDSNQTVNGTFTLTGSNASNYRLLIASTIIGTPRTITCNGTVTASNVDFMDIVGAGTANWDLSNIAGGSGDCGGNSGITFTPAQTQYHRRPSAGGSNWSTAGLWFTESGNAGRVPLPQDDVVFDENSFPIGNNGLYINVPRIGRSLNMEAVNQPITMTLANSIECYGSYVLGSNITPSGNYAVNLMGRGFYSLNLYGKSIYVLIINAYGGTYTNFSNITLNINSVSNYPYQHYNGTFDLNYFNLDCNNMYLTVGYLYLRNGMITLYGVPTANMLFLPTGFNLFTENSTIKCTRISGNDNYTFTGGGKTFNKVQLSGSHTGNFDIKGSNTFAELIIDSGRKVRFTNGTTQIINKLTAIGTPNQPITIGSTTAGQRHTINYTGSEASTVEYCNISDSKVTQARRLLAKNSVNAGNNQNWGFEELPPLALNFGQVDKMYVGGSEVVSAYYGEVKIK